MKPPKGDKKKAPLPVSKTTNYAAEPANLVNAPHSFVITRGEVGKSINSLMHDFRRVMEPFTATSLKCRKNNSIKDFLAMCGFFHVSNIIVFTKTDHDNYVRFCRTPRGPTLTFRIANYSLIHDILSSIKNTSSTGYHHHPLVILNNFSGDGLHFKLMASMFQNMFPSINVNTVKLHKIRRCLLFNYNKESDSIELRHYLIKAQPCGLNRTIKKVISNKIPNLGKYEDISQALQQGGSESEAEFDLEANKVNITRDGDSKTNVVGNQSAVRLLELGPRITMQLVKIEEGIMSGEVLYHKYESRTREEIVEQRLKIARKQKLKERRKAIQEDNRKRNLERRGITEEQDRIYRAKRMKLLKKKQKEKMEQMRQNWMIK